MNDTIRFLAARIHNSTRSCVLMRQFTNGIWSLPISVIDSDADPLTELESVLSQVDGKYDLVSAVCIVERSDKDPCGNNCQSYVYDIRYRGKINPECPQRCTQYVKGQWMQVDAIKLQKSLSYPTTALIEAMEVDACLK